MSQNKLPPVQSRRVTAGPGLARPSVRVRLLCRGLGFGRQASRIDRVKGHQLVYVKLALLRLDIAWRLRLHWEGEGVLRVHLVQATTVF